MSKLGLILGVLFLIFAFAAGPIPLRTTLENPTREVVIYPNLLFAVPMILLGALLLLYGLTAGEQKSPIS